MRAFRSVTLTWPFPGGIFEPGQFPHGVAGSTDAVPSPVGHPAGNVSNGFVDAEFEDHCALGSAILDPLMKILGDGIAALSMKHNHAVYRSYNSFKRLSDGSYREGNC